LSPKKRKIQIEKSIIFHENEKPFTITWSPKKEKWEKIETPQK